MSPDRATPACDNVSQRLDGAERRAVAVTHVAVLPGDGIGPEVMAEAIRVLDALGIEHAEHPFGGNAILAQGTPLPDETLAACREADAVLLAAVGLPELEGQPVRPEQGLLGLRRELGVYANLRPARGDGIDMIIVRELVGGLYFGEKGIRDDGTWFDTCEYSKPEVERIAHRAFEIARARGGRLTSVDKVNVMQTSKLWREVVTEMGATHYADVPLDHALVDSFAMTIVQAPETIGTVLTENTFGDILSDVAAAVTVGSGLPRRHRSGTRIRACSSRSTDRRPTSPAKVLPTPPRCCARSP